MSETPRFPYLLSAAQAGVTQHKTKCNPSSKIPDCILLEDSYVQMRGVLRPNDRAQAQPPTATPERKESEV